MRIDISSGDNYLSVNGCRISLAVFHALAVDRPSRWMKVISREDGMIVLQSPGPDLSRVFDDLIEADRVAREKPTVAT